MSNKFLLVISVGIVCCSCQQGPLLEQSLVEYTKRMAKVLEVEPATLKSVSLPPFPTLTSMQQNIPATNINLADFYQLKHCRIYSLVAERNTSLGRLQLPSTRYIYERQLLDMLKICLSQTSELILQDKLKYWLEIKTHQLPTVWANLIQTSSEIKYTLSSNSGLIEGDQQDGLNQTSTALRYLSELTPTTRLESATLEAHLKYLQNNPLPAKIWRSQLILTEHLNQLTAWLNKYKHLLTCKNEKPSQQTTYLTNVFRLFFIKKIQSIAGQLNYYHYQLSPILNSFEEHPHLSPNFKQYIQTQNKQGFERYSLAMQQHLAFWQMLFKRCNIAPGQT